MTDEEANKIIINTLVKVQLAILRARNPRDINIIDNYTMLNRIDKEIEALIQEVKESALPSPISQDQP